MAKAYYNENDPYAAAWLRELIKRDLIAPGDVDERSIVDVQPDDLDGYTRCHFFAGIGGWDLALQMAGWSDDAPVWTGSCPCQPFSNAGKRKGKDDERHLWPYFRELISARRPSIAFGEQVASRLGREWLAGVRADLEAVGYEVGAADLCAAGLGAPHIRQRLWWVADSKEGRRHKVNSDCKWSNERGSEKGRERSEYGSSVGRLADPEHQSARAGKQGVKGRSRKWRNRPPVDGTTVWMGNANGSRITQGHTEKQAGLDYQAVSWSDTATIPCGDGKARRLAPRITPLAHGIPARVVRLRGYGNAIVPQLAAEFITAYMEAVA